MDRRSYSPNYKYLIWIDVDIIYNLLLSRFPYFIAINLAIEDVCSILFDLALIG